MLIKGNIPKKHLSAINYYADALFSHQKRQHLELHIHYCHKKTEEYGTIGVLDYNSRNKPISFDIVIYRDDEVEMLKTLAHEMVHVKQYALGELNDEMTHWRGQEMDSDSIPYDEQEWEIEAETVGLILYQEFKSEQE